MKTSAWKQAARLPRRDAQRAISITTAASPEHSPSCCKTGYPSLGANPARDPHIPSQRDPAGKKNPNNPTPARTRNSSHPSLMDAAGILPPQQRTLSSSRPSDTWADEKVEEDSASTLTPSQHIPHSPTPSSTTYQQSCPIPFSTHARHGAVLQANAPLHRGATVPGK